VGVIVVVVREVTVLVRRGVVIGIKLVGSGTVGTTVGGTADEFCRRSRETGGGSGSRVVVVLGGAPPAITVRVQLRVDTIVVVLVHLVAVLVRTMVVTGVMGTTGVGGVTSEVAVTVAVAVTVTVSSRGSTSTGAGKGPARTREARPRRPRNLK
jgi:hypothetical protein